MNSDEKLYSFGISFLALTDVLQNIDSILQVLNKIKIGEKINSPLFNCLDCIVAEIVVIQNMLVNCVETMESVPEILQGQEFVPKKNNLMN